MPVVITRASLSPATCASTPAQTDNYLYATCASTTLQSNPPVLEQQSPEGALIWHLTKQDYCYVK